MPLDRSPLEPRLKRVSITDTPGVIEGILSFITLDNDAAVSTCSYTPIGHTMAIILQSSRTRPPTKLELKCLDQSLRIVSTNSTPSMCHKWKLFFEKGNVLPPFFLLPLASIQELWVRGYTDVFGKGRFPVRNWIEGLPVSAQTIWVVRSPAVHCRSIGWCPGYHARPLHKPLHSEHSRAPSARTTVGSSVAPGE